MKWLTSCLFAGFLLSGCAQYADIVKDPVSLSAFVKDGDIDALDGKYQHTMLHQAVMDNNFKAAEYLVKHGANVNAVNLTYNETPLSTAIIFGSVDMVKLLVDNGADLNKVEKQKLCRQALGMNKFDTVDYLIEHGVSLNAEAELHRWEDVLKSLNLNSAYERNVKKEIEQRVSYLEKLAEPSFQAYQALKKAPAVIAYQDFLIKYPRSRFAGEVHRALDDVHFREAKKINTPKAYETFLSSYPLSAHTDDVRALLRTQIDVKASQQFALIHKDDYAAYEAFIRSYPYASKTEEARSMLLDYKYAQAKKENTLQAYQSFQKLFPYSKYEEEIQERRVFLEQREVMDRIQEYLAKKDIDGFINYIQTNSAAKRVAQSIPKIALLLDGPDELMVVTVLNYKKQGISDMILASKIRSSGKPYKDFTLDEVSSLKKFGISDALLAAMLDVTAEHKKEQNRKLEQQTLIAKQEAIAKGMQEAQAKTLKQMQEQNAQNAQMQMQQSSGRSVGDILIEKGKEKMVDKLLEKFF